MAARVEVFGGEFFIHRFTARREAPSASTYSGVIASMDLRFCPRDDLEATEIHLVQTVKDTVREAGVSTGRTRMIGFTELRIANGDHKGLGIDMEFQGPLDPHMIEVMTARKDWLEAHAGDSDALAKQADADREMWALQSRSGTADKANTDIVTSLDPAYAQQRLTAEAPPFAAASSEETTGWACVRDASGAWGPVTGRPPRAQAALIDRPSDESGDVYRMDFEVAALAVGKMGPIRFVGSVRWGWDRSVNGLKLGLVPGDFDQATPAFFAAAAYFNDRVAPALAAQAGVPEDRRLRLPTGTMQAQELGTPVWGLPRARHGRWVRRGRTIIIEDD